ncbi:hypothetical protein [Vibrio splendidus]|uniref:hypothetical protein n=1 Tax=Vibrio splendidus TaxID=29497 RepID=UPI000E08DC15|nr:hypothetical protein [Vibrio splendidus]
MIKKSILLIAPSTYGFYSHIKVALSKLNFDVHFIDESIYPSRSLIGKIMLKLPRGVQERLHSVFLYRKIKKIECDFVIVIRGEYITSDLIELMKDIYSQSKFIMYQWDFKKNLPLLSDQIPYFDIIYSFDKNDSDKYSFKHKPLFYNSFHEQAAISNERYLFNFIGTDHSDRNEVLSRFLRENEVCPGKVFLHLYRPIRSIILNSIKMPAFLFNRDLSIYKYYPLSEIETIRAMSESKIIIDITQPGQGGLTMRTLEALGLRKKLVTTNRDIVNYDFYHPNNIYIIDRDNLKVPESFIDDDYVELNEDVYDRYHVDSWVKEFVETN